MMVPDKITCPSDGRILEYFSSSYSSVFVSLSPFIVPVSISSSLFYPETYPTRDKILSSCESLSWSEVQKRTGLLNINEVDIGLRSRILGLKEHLCRQDWAKALEDREDFVCPTEGEFSPFFERKFLDFLTEIGYSSVTIRDEFDDKSREVTLAELRQADIIPYAGSILTKDRKIYATTHWDSHFSFVCSSFEILEELIRSKDLEGFYCDEKTEVFWSVRNLTSSST